MLLIFDYLTSEELVKTMSVCCFMSSTVERSNNFCAVILLLYNLTCVISTLDM